MQTLFTNYGYVCYDPSKRPGVLKQGSCFFFISLELLQAGNMVGVAGSMRTWGSNVQPPGAKDFLWKVQQPNLKLEKESMEEILREIRGFKTLLYNKEFRKPHAYAEEKQCCSENIQGRASYALSPQACWYLDTVQADWKLKEHLPQRQFEDSEGFVLSLFLIFLAFKKISVQTPKHKLTIQMKGE